MTSYNDLYSDFLDIILLYTETLTVTPLAFMRWASEALSRMQRETRLLEADTTLVRDPAASSYWLLPENILDFIMLRDTAGFALVPKSAAEFQVLREQSSCGLPEAFTDPARFRQYPARGVRGLPTARIWTVRDRQLEIYPDNGDTELVLYFIPHLEAISTTSQQWAEWFLTDQFETRMQSHGPPHVYQPYSHALVAYAAMRALRSRRIRDFVVYEGEFREAVEQAKINKPVLDRVLQPLYRL